MKVEEQRERLDRWYGYMKNQQHEKADTQKEEIEARFNELTDPEIQKFYHLLKVRYHLMYKDSDKAEAALEKTGLEEDKYHWLNYYYYFFNGIYHYDRKEFKTAIDFYNKARLFISDVPIEETAELYYKLAAACNQNYEFTRSIKYTERALEVFENRSDYRRIFSCESLLGLNNYDIQQYKEAEKRFQNALVYVEKDGNKLSKMRILHNLGLLYSENNDSKTAIDYLNQVFELLDSEKNDFQDDYLKVQNLYLLAKNYFKTDKAEKASQMLDLGLTFSQNHDNSTYITHFHLLRAKFLEPNHIEEAYEEGISYFKDHELWEYVNEYSDELAFYYRKAGNHEDAAEYFHLAAEARNQIKKERMVYHD